MTITTTSSHALSFSAHRPGWIRELGGHAGNVMVLGQAQVHSAGGRIVVVVMVALMATLAVFIAWKSIGALRHLSRKPLSGRQRAVAAVFVGSEVMVTAIGVVVGYLAAATDSKISGLIVGGVAGAFIWLAMCWVVGGIVRARRAHHSTGSSAAL
jgi:hypothetical protein